LSRQEYIEVSARAVVSRVLARAGYAVLEVALGVLALAASSKARFATPLSPVPFTLQTLVLLYIILVLRERAWRPVLSYIALGLAGLPVFAYGGGPAYVFSPTFGYLVGFLLASFVGGRLASGRVLTPRKLVLSSLVSTLVIYAAGYAYLAAWLVAAARAGLAAALVAGLVSGVLIFIPWDLLKALAAAGLVVATNKVRARLLKELEEHLPP
jgi:biotin transport system substrate-specific component